MAEQFHYPPEVLNLLVDTIPLLCRSKKDVVLFMQGAGVDPSDLADLSRTVRTAPESINKYEITRTVLAKVNTRGDSGLRPRREIIKRVVEFEDYSTCWPNDQLKAKGLVASLRDVVNVKDSFTRMKQERDAEREQVLARQRAEQAAAIAKRAAIEDVSRRLFALFSMDDRPQERGKLLEAVLSDLFKAYGIYVLENFRRKDPDTGTVLEQIDGVIELDGAIHLVEMKWLNAPVGMGEFSPHLSRLFMRANAQGIFIATNGYTESVLTECKSALNQKTMFLCSLQEFVMLLQRQGDLVVLLKKKSQAAIIDKNPYLEVLA
ncbi:restriction endonuclease [Xanthomonas sp. GPE 39]|uniref:restriction endonuclease n=1 Tax=Xanthomonas sp. GPE 39 TaxID=1583099 RepID=UPI0005F2B164|nr:restriction endonuclease [Xanthomonas sp. GPE 39]